MLDHLIEKHYGPGPHASGSPQEVHGGGGGGVRAGVEPSSGLGYKGNLNYAVFQRLSPRHRWELQTHQPDQKRAQMLADLWQKQGDEYSAKQIEQGGRGYKYELKVVPVAAQEGERASLGPGDLRDVMTNADMEKLLKDPLYFYTKSTAMTPSAFQARRVFDKKKREKLAGEGKALPWGGFPIENCGDVKNAVQAIGRAKDRSRTIAHIKHHASSLGCTHLIPKTWRAGAKTEEKSAVAMNEDAKFYDSDEQLVHRARVAGLDPQVLLKRRSIRAKAHADDIALLEAGYSDNPARRPDDISSEVWRSMEAHERTVGAVVWRRHIERKYDEAVEDALLKGWKGQKNPSRPEEWVFKSWIDTPDGWQLVRTILVRKSDSEEWYMKEVSRGASLSLSIRVAPNEVRR